MGRERFAAVALAAALAACADGYPSEDRPLPNPHDLDNPGRLAVMNEIGREAQPARRWTYTLGPDCALQVAARGSRDAAPSAHTVTLPRTLEAELRFDRDAGTYAVLMAPEGPVLLEARRFNRASQFLLLLRLVARDCGRPPP